MSRPIETIPPFQPDVSCSGEVRNLLLATRLLLAGGADVVTALGPASLQHLLAILGGHASAEARGSSPLPARWMIVDQFLDHIHFIRSPHKLLGQTSLLKVKSITCLLVPRLVQAMEALALATTTRPPRAGALTREEPAKEPAICGR